MAKLKYILVIVLAVVIVIAGAFLPRLVADFRDEATLGKAGFEWMQPVEFEIHRNIPSMGKLAMMAQFSGAVEIPESKATMTAQQVREACGAALQPYIDAGLMAEFVQWQVELCPYLIQTPVINGIVWTVTIFDGPEGLYLIDAVIDDETGQLLRIDVMDQQFRGSELRTEYLYAFADLFFSGLGITDYDYAAFETDDLKKIGTGADALRYRFGDAVYGEVNVDLYVFEYGFYVEFPQMEVAADEWA